MVRIWAISDLHQERSGDIRAMLPLVQADALIIAGDHHHSRQAVSTARQRAGDLPLIMVGATTSTTSRTKLFQKVLPACVGMPPPIERRTKN